MASSTPTQRTSQNGQPAQQQQQGACPVLHLDLGPLHLDLLGLVVDLNEVVLDITAQPGALLGNLLCSLTNLLSSVLGNLVSSLSSALSNVLGNLVNGILGRLGLSGSSSQPAQQPQAAAA